MHTNLPDIYAAGDMVETVDPLTGRVRVIGQWYPAVQQGRAAAYSMLDLLDMQRSFHASTFYNATFLYGLDFAATGLTTLQEPHFQDILADPQPYRYRKVTLNNDVPVGMLALGDRREVLAFKRATDYGISLAPISSSLFVDGFSLNDWLDSQNVPPPMMGVSKVMPVPAVKER